MQDKYVWCLMHSQLLPCSHLVLAPMTLPLVSIRQMLHLCKSLNCIHCRSNVTSKLKGQILKMIKGFRLKIAFWAAKFITKWATKDAIYESCLGNLPTANFKASCLEYFIMHAIQELSKVFVCILLSHLFKLFPHTTNILHHAARRDGPSGRSRIGPNTICQTLKVFNDCTILSTLF